MTVFEMTGRPAKLGFVSASPAAGQGRARHRSLDIVAVGAGNIGLLIIGLVSGVVSARVLGPSIRGEYLGTQTWATLAAVLLTLGVTQAIVTHPGNNAELLGVLYLQPALALLVGLGLFTALATTSLLPWLSVTGIVGGAALTSAGVISANLAGIAQRQGKMLRHFQVVRLLPPAIGLICTGILALIGWRNSNVWLFWLGSTMLAAAALTQVSLLRMFSPSQGRAKLHPGAPFVRRAVGSFATVVAAQVVYRLDVLLVSVCLPVASIAMYGVAVAAGTGCAAIGQSIGMVAFSDFRKETGAPAQKYLIRRSAIRAVVVTSSVAVPLAILAPSLIRLTYGTDFVSAASATRVLAIASVPLSVDYLMIHMLLSLDAAKTAARMQAVAVVLTVGMLVGAIATGQIAVVASVSLVVYSISAVLLYAVAIRHTNHNSSDADRRRLQLKTPWERTPESVGPITGVPALSSTASERVAAEGHCLAVIIHWGNTEPSARLATRLARLPIPLEVVVLANDLSVRPVGLHESITWLVPPRNLGFAGGFAHAAKEISSQFYLLLNNDVLIDEECILLCLSAFADPVVGIVGPVLTNDGGLQSGVGKLNWLYHSSARNPPTSVPLCDAQWITGAVMFIRGACYEQVQMDLSYFLGYEDADLCLRARSAGWRVVIASRAEATHQGGATIPTYGAYYHFIRNRLWFTRKWGNPTQSALVWSAVALKILPRVFLADTLKRRNYLHTRSVLHALLDGMGRLPGHSQAPVDEPRPARWGRWT